MPATAKSYAARQPPAEPSRKPVTVLVTGFGPFLEYYPRNSSWEVASTLPALIPASPENLTPIHLHVYHEAIRVAYDRVLSLVPTLLPPENPLYPPPDLILHIGVAAGREYFTLEQGAHGRGFGAIADVDGHRFPDSDAEKIFPSSEYPSPLKTSFDTSDVLKRWKANLGLTSGEGNADKKKGPDVRLSPDAGNFMCGFIYYNSLAHYYALNSKYRPVAFMHVPDLSHKDEKKQKEGWEVTVALIKALVESKLKNGAVDGSEALNIEARDQLQSGQVDDSTTQGI